jgi:phosphoglycerate dehydrogenase-like enzyme
MPTVLVSAPYIIPIIDRFRAFLESYGVELIIAEVIERLSEEELMIYAGKFDGALCGDDKYTHKVLEACSPRLKVLSKWGTGIDSIDQETAARLGIQVYRTANAFTIPVSDSVLGYMLAFSRQLPWMDRSVKSGAWNKIPGHTLSECTLGVIGVGKIGKAVIRKARGFGARFLGNDIVEIDPDFLAENGIRMTSLEDLLAGSDFVSLNCDLNPSSYHLINRRTLSLMKSNAILINTARGPIVDESALIEALQYRTIGGAALDVFEAEPLAKNSPLFRLDNVMLAPHNANSSPAAWERVHWRTISNLLIGLGYSPPENNPGI